MEERMRNKVGYRGNVRSAGRQWHRAGDQIMYADVRAPVGEGVKRQLTHLALARSGRTWLKTVHHCTGTAVPSVSIFSCTVLQ